ncbi:MAG: response regulator [Chitinophagales bacterium]
MEYNELKVLVIEDNAGDAFLIKFYLGESMSPKFHFFHAENLATAETFLAREKFDIVLMDLNLPDSVGLATIKKVLDKYPNNLVIVLTGLTDEKVGLETVRYGAQDFLVKGKFDGKVLISSIMFAFERFHLNKELNKGEERFNNLQWLMQTGYIEIDVEKKLVFLSKPLLEELGLPMEKEISGLRETLEQFENPEEIVQMFQNVAGSSDEHEIQFRHKMYTKGEARLRWKMQHTGKIIGAVFPVRK